MEDVYNACASYWTWLAYWAAQFRGNQFIVDAAIQDLNLWNRYVGPTWTELMAILNDISVENLGTPEAKLGEAAARVALQWIPLSLKQIGFRHLVMPEGEALYIDRHDFPGAPWGGWPGITGARAGSASAR
ncbi:hypothetical protein ABIA30_004031 [Mycobacterium sp. MAA66]|uniref:hypothetical protein n=1 Tax=Mycobacterium sp. MAA66 TaxID=3156297 RepID=UPI0035169703